MKHTKRYLLVALVLITLLLVAVPAYASSVEAENGVSVSIDRFNLSFEDSIYIKYAVNLTGADVATIGKENFRVLFWTSPKEEYTLETAESSATNLGYQTIGGTKYYIFSYDDLAAKQMTDDIYARAYVNVDGKTYYSDVEKYSVLQYAYNKLGYTGTATTDTDLQNLLHGMLSYGAYAQKYFDYKTDHLADMRYYQITVEGGTLEDGSKAGLYHSGETVILKAPAGEEESACAIWQNSAGEFISADNSLTLTSITANETYTRAVFAEHSVVIDPAVEATCSTPGLTEGKHCSRCSKILVKQTAVDASYHQTYITIPAKMLYTTTNSTAYPFSISGNQITSTNKANSSGSTYTITANQAFTLKLQYMVSSEATYDKLVIKHNSTTKVTASGTQSTSYTALDITMSAGDTVTITYSKDSSASQGDDCAYIKILTENSLVEEERTELVQITEENSSSLASCLEDILCSACGQVAIEKTEHVYSNNICGICGDNKRHFVGGNGTETSPYLISTAKHLDNIRLYPDAHYKLINDIQFTTQDFNYSGSFYNSGKYWMPIADFSGTLDGNNYSIIGLKMNHSYAGEKIGNRIYSSAAFGLFAEMEGKVTNLTLSNVNIQIFVSQANFDYSYFSTSVDVGGVAGICNGEITNCTVSGTVTVTGQTDMVRATAGGIIGQAYSGCSIYNSRNNASVKVTCTKYTYSSGEYTSYSYATAGGIVGDFKGSNITGCINHGAVSASSIKTPYAGGIIGECSQGMIDGNINTQISDCYNYGAVEASSYPPSSIDRSGLTAYAGGIVAYMDETSVVNCGNYADVSANGYGSCAGGVVGSVYSSNLIAQCFNKGAVLAYDTVSTKSSSQSAGGISGNGGCIDQCYNTGSVTATGTDHLSAGGITTVTFEKIGNCYNTGTVSAQEGASISRSGGIVVQCSGAIEHCYNIGALSGDEKGGIAALVYDGSSADNEFHILDCYFKDNVTAGVYEYLNYPTVTVYKKTAADLKEQSTFTNFDFSEIWVMADEGYAYPQLQNNLHKAD